LTGLDVAIKIIPKCLLQDASPLHHFKSEVKTLTPINHPLIGRIYDVFEEPESYSIVSECATCDLLDYVNRTRGIPEQECRVLFSQLVSAVSFLHDECHVVHRDLKLENVLLDRNGNIRLIDFGFAKSFSDTQNIFSSRCGSPAYIAPEVIASQPYTTAVDVWSLGVMLYAMVTGTLPFQGAEMDSIFAQIAFIQPLFPPSLSANLAGLLAAMLEKDGRVRITLAQVKQHPWLEHTDAWAGITDVDAEILERVCGLGVEISEHDVRNDVKNQAVVCYKILERRKLVDGREPGTVSPKPGPEKAPMIRTSPMRPSKRPHLAPLWTPTRQRGGDNDAALANAAVLSPVKQGRMCAPGSPMRRQALLKSPKRLLVK
jgi:serine/threonine protein kinase